MNSSIDTLEFGLRSLMHECEEIDITNLHYNLNFIANKFSGINSEIEEAYKKAAINLKKLDEKYRKIVFNVHDIVTKFIEETRGNESDTFRNITDINTVSDKLLQELDNLN